MRLLLLAAAMILVAGAIILLMNDPAGNRTPVIAMIATGIICGVVARLPRGGE